MENAARRLDGGTETRLILLGGFPENHATARPEKFRHANAARRGAGISRSDQWWFLRSEEWIVGQQVTLRAQLR
jgi:hypothetical protein